MTTFIVLRHAQSTANERGLLAGQLPGIHLSATGVDEAEALKETLAKVTIDRVISSPLERCLQTIEPLVAAKKMKIATDDRLIEMNYGKWSGKKLSFLSVRPLWRKIQSSPSDVTFPDGESFANMASRVGSLLEELHRKYPKESLLLVTHGDICKFIATYFLKLPLNDLQKFLVKPASLSIFHQTSEKIAVEVFNSSATKTVKVSADTARSMPGGETGKRRQSR